MSSVNVFDVSAIRSVLGVDWVTISVNGEPIGGITGLDKALDHYDKFVIVRNSIPCWEN